MHRILPLLLAVAACSSAPSQPPPPPGATGWTAGVVERPASGDAQAEVADVRAARHAGYDRVVFEFDALRPAVHVAYVDRPVRACGSGEVVDLPGDGWLEIRFTGARAHTVMGEPTAAPSRRPLAFPNALLMAQTCDFEGQVTWVVGVRTPEPYRVVSLDGPPRVAVDVLHPVR